MSWRKKFVFAYYGNCVIWPVTAAVWEGGVIGAVKGQMAYHKSQTSGGN